MADPEEETMEEERQHKDGRRSEEEEEMLRSMRGWCSERDPILKLTDCVGEDLGKREESEGERQEDNQEK